MFRLKLRRFLAEREVLVGLIIFGVLAMIADILADLERTDLAAAARILAIVVLILFFIFDTWYSRRRPVITVPLVFTEETNREIARTLFDRFAQSMRLTKSVKVIESLSPVRQDDLLIRLDRTKPRQSSDPDDWRAAWRELLREWEREVDKQLLKAFTEEARVYHVFPHVVLPLAFALGASVGLRRSVVIYHQEQEQFDKVLELTEPRRLFEAPSSSSAAPEREEYAGPPDADKLLLHLVITDRHPINIESQAEHTAAASAALIYRMALPDGDWLAYVQHLVTGALSLMGSYKQVEVRLLCPSAVAFALGIAFSRTPNITVCHWIDNQYRPVFSLTEIEKHLPFD